MLILEHTALTDRHQRGRIMNRAVRDGDVIHTRVARHLQNRAVHELGAGRSPCRLGRAEPGEDARDDDHPRKCDGCARAPLSHHAVLADRVRSCEPRRGVMVAARRARDVRHPLQMTRGRRLSGMLPVALFAALLAAGCGEERKAAETAVARRRGRAHARRSPSRRPHGPLPGARPHGEGAAADAHRMAARVGSAAGRSSGCCTGVVTPIAAGRATTDIASLDRAPERPRGDAGGRGRRLLQRLVQRRPWRPAAVGDLPPDGATRPARARLRRGPPARHRGPLDGRLRSDVLRRPPPGDVRRRGVVQRCGDAAAQRRAHPRHRVLRRRRRRRALGLPDGGPEGLGGARPDDARPRLRGTRLFVSSGNGTPGPLDHTGTTDPTEVSLHGENAAFVRRLRSLELPATVDLYGAGTHSWPYWERELHRALPLLLSD